MTEYPETHMQGIVSIESANPFVDVYGVCDFGVRIANDGRVWICVNGKSFLRFKPTDGYYAIPFGKDGFEGDSRFRVIDDKLACRSSDNYAALVMKWRERNTNIQDLEGFWIISKKTYDLIETLYSATRNSDSDDYVLNSAAKRLCARFAVNIMLSD